MPNFSSLAGLEVAEKFLWGAGWVGGVVCTVIFMSNPTVVLCCVGVGVGVLTTSSSIMTITKTKAVAIATTAKPSQLLLTRFS